MTNDAHDKTLEQLINDTDALLRCPQASAYESADNLRDSQRDHAFPVVHLLDVIRHSFSSLAIANSGLQRGVNAI